MPFVRLHRFIPLVTVLALGSGSGAAAPSLQRKVAITARGPILSDSTISPINYQFVTESGLQNQAVDPGETVTVTFTIANDGFGPTTNLVATMRPSAQIANVAPSQSYGSVGVGDFADLNFTFTASAVAYSPVLVTFDLTDGANSLGDITFELAGGQPPAIPAPAGLMLVAESFTPANNLPDVGETVTVGLTIKNNGSTATTNLVGTLLANVPVGASGTPQSFGTIAPGASVTRPFTLTVNGTPGTSYGITLQLSDTGLNYGTATFRNFRVARAAQLVVDALTLTSESASPANGSPDPGEVVTAAVSLRNVGETAAQAVSAQLLATGGVLAPVPAAAQSYGLIAGGSVSARSFTFTGGSPCGSPLTATLLLADGVTGLGTTTYGWLAGYPTQTFSSGTAIVIPATLTSGFASPYPSVINVSGLNGTIARVTVSLKGLAHEFPADIDALLTSPTGQQMILMSDCGGFTAVSGGGVDLVLDDSAPAALPNGPILTSGTFTPTNFGAGDIFPVPAPAGPYGSTLSVFNGSPATGAWSLYVVDDSDPGVGSMQRGWSVTIATSTAACLDTSTDVSASISGLSSSVVTAQPVNATFSIANGTPNPASGVQLVIPLPASATFVSATPSQGNASFDAGTNTVTVGLGIVPGLSSASVILRFIPTGTGAQSLTGSVTILQSDTNLANNAANFPYTVLADSDGDGIPDDYELANGMNPNNPADAAQDFDGDGLTNLQEYRAGTDPRNAASALRITSVSRSGTGASITFPSVNGKFYRLERQPLLESGAWISVQENIPGTGSPVMVTDAAATGFTKQFYRIVVP